MIIVKFYLKGTVFPVFSFIGQPDMALVSLCTVLSQTVFLNNEEEFGITKRDGHVFSHICPGEGSIIGLAPKQISKKMHTKYINSYSKRVV